MAMGKLSSLLDGDFPVWLLTVRVMESLSQTDSMTFTDKGAEGHMLSQKLKDRGSECSSGI